MKKFLSFSSNLLLLTFVTLSLMTAGAQASSECSSLFQSTGSTPTETKYIKLEPGQQIWGKYTCKACQSLVIARPGKNGEQGCRNCGSPHSGEEYSPPETVERDGKLYLVEPGNLITSVDPSSKYASSGKVWKCGFCQGTNFNYMLSCDTCGGAKTGFDAPADFSLGEPKDFPKDEFAAGASKPTKIESAEQMVQRAKAIDVQQPGSPKSFLRTRAGALLMSAAAVGVSGFIWWGTETYTLPAQVTSISAETAYVFLPR